MCVLSLIEVEIELSYACMRVHLKNNIYTCVQPYYPQNDQSKTSYFLQVSKKPHQQPPEPCHFKKQLVIITNVSVI